MSKELIAKLAVIQKTLKAPKNQFNKFGKYNYRSCQDILEGLKSVLNGLVVTVEDDVQMVGDRVYIKSTATLTDGDNSITNSAFARESLTKKGMDDSQITGTASSYARKYALNGLFLIDDTKDADSMDNSTQGSAATVIDATAQGWINACKTHINALEQITDPQYKAFIKANL
tara:strand:- start:1801 stop:2319 length:519 start_codon:yes stop_codon:yes gene_type:complete